MNKKHKRTFSIEEKNGIKAKRVKDTIINECSEEIFAKTDDFDNEVENFKFYTVKKISKIPLALKIENTCSVNIPDFSTNLIKVSLHFYNNKPICDVYYEYILPTSIEEREGYLSAKEAYYIPEGIYVDLFKRKKFSNKKYLDKKIFEEKFFHNSKILYFKFHYYCYTEETYTINEYDIYFKSLINNITYRYNVFSRELDDRYLICYYDGKPQIILFYLFLLKIIKKKLLLNSKAAYSLIKIQSFKEHKIAKAFIQLATCPSIIKYIIFQFLEFNICWPKSWGINNNAECKLLN